MSDVNCCTFPRSTSPDLPNSRIVQSPQQSENDSLQQLDPLPAVIPASTMGSAQSREIRQIFASSQDDDARKPPSSRAWRKGQKRELPPTVLHRGSNGRLYRFTERLKRKMSRDSGLSRRSSRMRLRHSISEEDIERRQELKRALHRRLQEDLLRDRSASQGGYDEDAMPITTPRPTLGRNEGFDQINPEDIVDEVGLRDAAPQTSDRNFGSQGKPEKYSPKVTTVQNGSTVRKVLRKKKSAAATYLSDQPPPDTAIEPEIRLASGQSASPFHFNSLTIPKRSRLSLQKASVDRSDTAKGNSQVLKSGFRVKGASSMFGRSTPDMRLQFGYAGQPSHQLSHKAICDPAIEEIGFGGIDGVADSREPVTVFTEQRPMPYQELQPVGLVASRSIRISQSLSQLGDTSGQWHKRRSSSVYSRQPKINRSSSQYSTRSSILREVLPRTKQPANRSNDNLHWRRSQQHIASSVYSTRGGSRQSIPNLDGSWEPYPPGRRQSTAYDLFSAENKGATSLWQRAFLDHAEEDAATMGGRRSSMLPRRKGSMAIRRRVSVSQDTGSVIPKRGLPEGERNGLRRPILRRLEKYSSASSLRSLSPSGRVRDPIGSGSVRGRRGRNASSARSSGSWSRYPSHTRAERSSSPASSSDGVMSRDFAREIVRTQKATAEPFGTFPAMDKRKSRSLTFRKSIANTLGRLYRSQVELRGYIDRGHRSSISAGGLAEYPELELPAGLGDCGATVWSKMYEDCVPPRDAIDESSVVDLTLASPKWRPSISHEAVGRTRKISRGESKPTLVLQGT